MRRHSPAVTDDRCNTSNTRPKVARHGAANRRACARKMRGTRRKCERTLKPSAEGRRSRSGSARGHLTEFGVEAGPDTIHTHLTHAHGGIAPCSTSSVWRILTRRGFITPEPHKRPRSSYVRFEAALPNECWQTDMTHVSLKNGRSVEVLNVIDDYSRLCVASRAFPVTTAADVVTVFYETAQQYGFPASVLSDNGAIFTASFRGDRGALATELAQRGIVFKHSRPYHPQTCGKVERFHQTMRYLAANRPRARSSRPTRHLRAALQQRTPPPSKNRTPRAAYNARVKAKPAEHPYATPASSASDATASTKPAKSPCATPANSATSASDEPTKATRPHARQRPRRPRPHHRRKTHRRTPHRPGPIYQPRRYVRHVLTDLSTTRDIAESEGDLNPHALAGTGT